MLRQASAAGARLAHFPEGFLSGYAVEDVASWDGVDWALVRSELEDVAALAGELGIWVVLGSAHPLTEPHWPHNSLYVISDEGRLVDRYDKRKCSHTELTRFYTPGFEPVVFDVDGFRFGLAICIEINFSDMFAEYERLGVDCLLLSAYPVDSIFATKARAYAAIPGPGGRWHGAARSTRGVGSPTSGAEYARSSDGVRTVDEGCGQGARPIGGRSARLTLPRGSCASQRRPAASGLSSLGPKPSPRRGSTLDQQGARGHCTGNQFMLPTKGGRMPYGSDRQAFLDWLDQSESFPTRLARDESTMVADLLGCQDTLPGIYCSQLGLPQGSSYAEAARGFAHRYRLRTAKPAL